MAVVAADDGELPSSLPGALADDVMEEVEALPLILALVAEYRLENDPPKFIL